MNAYILALASVVCSMFPLEVFAGDHPPCGNHELELNESELSWTTVLNLEYKIGQIGQIGAKGIVCAGFNENEQNTFNKIVYRDNKGIVESIFENNELYGGKILLQKEDFKYAIWLKNTESYVRLKLNKKGEGDFNSDASTFKLIFLRNLGRFSKADDYRYLSLSASRNLENDKIRIMFDNTEVTSIEFDLSTFGTEIVQIIFRHEDMPGIVLKLSPKDLDKHY